MGKGATKKKRESGGETKKGGGEVGRKRKGKTARGLRSEDTQGLVSSQEQVCYRSETDMPLGAWTAAVTAGGSQRLMEEFQELRAEALQMGPPTYTTRAFDLNPLKNRYKDVHCWDHTRVVLKAGLGQPDRDYIHANFVDGALDKRRYILTQGPVEDTPGLFENSIQDFWTMVWEQKVVTIIMLCTVVEQGKAKCAQYWPEQVGQRMEFGPVRVECVEVLDREEYDHAIWVRRLEILVDGYTNTRQVYHLLHGSWPDRSCPPSAAPLLKFIVRSHSTNSKGASANGLRSSSCPILVHCSAGIGRSGTFIAIDIALYLINSYSALNVKEIVRRIRTQRAFSVQNPVQYALIHQALLDYAARHCNIPYDAVHFAKEIARMR